MPRIPGGPEEIRCRACCRDLLSFAYHPGNLKASKCKCRLWIKTSNQAYFKRSKDVHICFEIRRRERTLFGSDQPDDTERVTSALYADVLANESGDVDASSPAKRIKY